MDISEESSEGGQCNGPLILNLIMSSMEDANGAVPKQFWGLSRSTDLLAPRGFVISDESYATYSQRLSAPWPYQVVSLRINGAVDRPVTVIPGVKTVTAYLLKRRLTLAAGIEKLTLGSVYVPLEDLPDGLLELEISYVFNYPLILPANLRRLSMFRAVDFNQPITLPDSIRRVSLGGRFDQPLLLPPNMESLEFGTFSNHPESDEGRFNHPLSLPDSMKRLILSVSFNQPLTLGENVEELYLGWDFNQPITFPTSLKGLSLECTSYDHLLDLPQQLRTLTVSHVVDPEEALPTYLQSIQVGDALVPRLVFPPGLYHLEWSVDLPITLPESLKVVEFGYGFTHAVTLPEGLEEAGFSNPDYNMPLVLPSTLKVISLDDSYNFPLDYPQGCAHTREQILERISERFRARVK